MSAHGGRAAHYHQDLVLLTYYALDYSSAAQIGAIQALKYRLDRGS